MKKRATCQWKTRSPRAFADRKPSTWLSNNGQESCPMFMIHDFSLGWASPGISSSILNSSSNFQRLSTQAGLNQWCSREECAGSPRPRLLRAATRCHGDQAPKTQEKLHSRCLCRHLSAQPLLSMLCLKSIMPREGYHPSQFEEQGIPHSLFFFFLSRSSPLYRSTVLQVFGRERVRKERLPAPRHHQLLSALLWE